MSHEAFYRITYGLYVVGSGDGDRMNGFVSNTVFQVTASPARFAVACNKDNFTCELIRQSGVYSISVLQQEARADLIGLFGYKSGRTVFKYETVSYRTGRTGAPVLLEDTLAWFECRVVQTIDVGTHMLFVGEVVESGVLPCSEPPLTYAYYREVKKGKSPKNAPTFISSPEPERAEPVRASLPKYSCAICGHTYDPAAGDPDSGIPPGTLFEDLPVDWCCPVCGAAKSEFSRDS